MSWTTINIKEYSDLYFPDECPNCLVTPSNEFVRIKRTVGLNLLKITYAINWPFCKTCMEFFKQRNRLKNRFSIYTLIALGIIFITTIILLEPLNLGGSGLIYPLIVLLITGLLIYLKYRNLLSKIPLNPGHIIKDDTVKIIRGGKKMFSDKRFLIISILNPKYAKLFIEKNIINNPKYNEQALKSALDLLELQKR